MKGPKCSTQIKRCIRRELQPSALTISKSDVLVRSTGTGALSGSTSIIGTTDIDASSITVDDLNATTAQISKMRGFTLTSGITFNNISNTGPFRLDNWSMYSSGDDNVLTVTDNTGNAKLNAAGTAGILYLEGAATEIKSRISDITLLSSEGSIIHNTKRGSKILTTNNVTGTALNLFDPDNNEVFTLKTTGNVGIGNTDPRVSLHIGTDDAIVLPKGTTEDRPNNIVGAYRFNTTLGRFEGYDGSRWGAPPTGTLQDQDGNTKITPELEPGSNDDTIRFYTEGDLKMTLDKAGHLGIGTTLPSSFLTVDGSIAFKNYTNAGDIIRHDRDFFQIFGYNDTLCWMNKSGQIFEVAERNLEPALHFWALSKDLNDLYTNYNVGIKTTDPQSSLHIDSTDSIVIPSGNTSQRGTALRGAIRYNTEVDNWEGYTGTGWGNISAGGGSAVQVVSTYTNMTDNYVLTSSGANSINGESNLQFNGTSLTINTNGSLIIPVGTDAQRVAQQGAIRYNTTDSKFEGYNGSSWGDLGGGGGGGDGTVGDPSPNTFSTIPNANLSITPETTVTNAFYSIDSWILKHIVDTPPPPTNSGYTLGTDRITITWTNIPRQEIGFYNVSVPHVDQIKIDFAQGNAFPGTTISTGSADTNELVLFIEGSGTGRTGNTYNYYTISAQTTYDFRIYGVNQNGTDAIQYLNVNALATLGIGVPGVPTSLGTGSITTTSMTISWTKPADHDTTTGGNQTTPFIKQYNVRFVATKNRSYFSTHDSHSGDVQTSITNSSNSSTSKSVTSLYPGHQYSFYVKAKNTQNDDWGAESSLVSAFTSDPSAPTTISSSNANSLSGATAFSSAKQLNGNSLSPSGTVYKHNSISSWSPLETATTGNKKQNYIISAGGSGNVSVGTLFAYGGNTASLSYATLSLGGFDTDLSNNTSNTVGPVKLVLNSEGDAYSGTSVGFWKHFNAHAETSSPGTYYPSQFTSYSLYLRYEPENGSNVNTYTNNFYVDDLNANPAIVADSDFIYQATSAALTNVSGVPSYTTSSVFGIQFTMTNICHRFLRNDCLHAKIKLVDSGGSRRSSETSINKGSGGTNVGGGSHYYYDIGASAYTQGNKHNGAGTLLSFTNHSSPSNIQFRDYTLSMNYNSTNLYDENIRVQVRPYNLKASGSYDTASGAIDPSNGNSRGVIRIDSASTSRISTISGLSAWVKSGTGQYPSGTLDTTYDHTVNIATDASNTELQLVNSYFYSPTSGSSNGYKNYSSGYYFEGSSGPDYTSIAVGGGSYTATDFRYHTVKFTNVLDDTTKFRITINNSSNFSAYDDDDHQLIVKVTNTGTSTTSNWLNCSGARNVAQDLTYSSANGITVASVSGSGVSTGTLRYCYCPQVTGGGSVVYVRIGLRNNSNKYFSHISIQNNWS